MAAAGRDVLIAEVGGQRFGLLAADVQELVRAVTIVAVPHAAANLEGLINLRGRIIPVLDLHALLGLTTKSLQYTDHLIVARIEERVVALRVDHALELIHVNDSDLGESHDIPGEIKGARSVARLPDGLVLIYDLKKLLSQAESAEIDNLLNSSGSTLSHSGEAPSP